MIRTDKPLKIAVMTKPLDNWKSGSGHHLDELMKHVLDLCESEFKGEFEFTFVHYKQSDNPIYNRVDELIVKRNPFAASKILKKKNFDIIHYSPLSVFAPVWGIKAKKTATVHGIEERLFPKGYSRIQRLHDCYIQSLYMRAMDGIATVSETGRQWFISNYRIKPDSIIVTTNGLSNAYTVLPENKKHLSDFPLIDRPFILHMSNCSLRKNPQTVIKGFSAFIKETDNDYLLVCAGRGWDNSDIIDLAKMEGIENRLITPGFVSEDAAVRLLNMADAFVFPSWAEGFGMPNVEAMACGCPVITSNIFAIPEVVGDAAILISKPDAVDEFALALKKITSDVETKKALVKRGLEQSKKYNWNDSAHAILGFWKKLIPNF